jgi:hypothetical protein
MDSYEEFSILIGVWLNFEEEPLQCTLFYALSFLSYQLKDARDLTRILKRSRTFFGFNWKFEILNRSRRPLEPQNGKKI